MALRLEHLILRVCKVISFKILILNIIKIAVGGELTNNMTKVEYRTLAKQGEDLALLEHLTLSE